MPCNIENKNWLTSFKEKIACGVGSITVDQMRTAIIGFQIENLLERCPTILDGDDAGCNIATSVTLSSMYERIKCGVMLTEAETLWAQSNILIKVGLCDIQTADNDPVDGFEIIADGIHPWAGGSTTADFISVVGLLSTDIVITTLVQRASNEALIVSLNDAANDQIDLTLSHNGTNATTKIAYQVLRAN
jgi:hypothetical protein